MAVAQRVWAVMVVWVPIVGAAGGFAVGVVLAAQAGLVSVAVMFGALGAAITVVNVAEVRKIRRHAG